MSTLVNRVMGTILNPDVQAARKTREEAYQQDVEKFKAMADVDLAEAVEYYQKNSQPGRWPRGTPVYDSVMEHVLIPEMVKRLRKK